MVRKRKPKAVEGWAGVFVPPAGEDAGKPCILGRSLQVTVFINKEDAEKFIRSFSPGITVERVVVSPAPRKRKVKR